MYNDMPTYGDGEDGWGDDDYAQSPTSPTDRSRAASVGRYGNSRGVGGVESWRNNYSDEYDDLDEYDRQEDRYRQSMWISG